MTDNKKNPDHRYVNDLRRLDYTQSTALRLRSVIIPIGISVIFLAFIAIFAGTRLTGISEEPLLIVIAAVIGGYMAINIGANDVANNMGPAVGGKVLTVFWAIVIAAVCESAGALLAGGDVVKTVSKGIITPGDNISVIDFRYLMLSALLAAAVWINLATFVGAPVSTTHSIVGGVLGAGIAAAGVGLVNWSTMSAIAASWVISPVFGAAVAAALLLFIKVNILNVSDRLAAAKTWVPVLIGIMAAAFVAYMAMKGLKKIWKPSIAEIAIYALIGFVLALLASRPYILKKISKLQNKKKDINGLFDLPLIIGVAFLSFAHGANDVANAVGPLAAIVSTIGEGAEFSSQVSIPTWVMVVGAFGIALGLGLFGPKLIGIVGEKITRLNSPRAYCVALSSAITVLIASALGLPVSSTHIAVGAVFGVGFLREYTEHPARRKYGADIILSDTAEDAIVNSKAQRKRRLVRRRFVLSIAAAWVVTVPASALLAALIYAITRLF
ncbi:MULTISPECIES: inorganic phosphate transporter [unclassified Lentilitoribacter]|uniref:inorganic phosphate transporter n=1 Tax=unclassified Lentilitoribacter TaxID=2647570 RepID=UPI0013A6FFC5|nr:inorganic phosphate transporter [Lentilitoribacter sp. Alg239-R112]